MSFYGNPDELDHLAMQIERRAEEVRDHASGMDARAGAMRWKSVAADRARETVTGDRRKLDETAQRLDEAATLLRRYAQDVRETIAEIKRIEQAVTAWFGKAVEEFNNAVAEFKNLIWRKTSPGARFTWSPAGSPSRRRSPGRAGRTSQTTCHPPGTSSGYWSGSSCAGRG